MLSRHHARVSIHLLVPLIVILAGTVQAAPDSWDWRDYEGHDLVGRVDNQGPCGSCYIVAAVDMVESRLMIDAYSRTGQVHEVNFSDQYILACGTGYFGDFDCNGGWPADVLEHMRDIGAPLASCYEYLGADSTCPADCPDSADPLVLHRPVSSYFYNSTYISDNDLMDEIMSYGPVATSVDVYDDFQLYSGGIYENVSGTFRGSTSVLFVGWGIEGSTPYWICKNTWGTTWGEDGYFRILRGTNECSIGEWTYMAEIQTALSATPDVPAGDAILAQNVPNPFNPATTIAYTPPAGGRAVLAVFDVAGRRVRTLVDADHTGGNEYSVAWDGRDSAGRSLPSGLYFYRLECGRHRETRRMVMLR